MASVYEQDYEQPMRDLEALIAVLAWARIGAIHSVVFGGLRRTDSGPPPLDRNSEAPDRALVGGRRQKLPGSPRARYRPGGKSSAIDPM